MPTARQITASTSTGTATFGGGPGLRTAAGVCRVLRRRLLLPTGLLPGALYGRVGGPVRPNCPCCTGGCAGCAGRVPAAHGEGAGAAVGVGVGVGGVRGCPGAPTEACGGGRWKLPVADGSVACAGAGGARRSRARRGRTPRAAGRSGRRPRPAPRRRRRSGSISTAAASALRAPVAVRNRACGSGCSSPASTCHSGSGTPCGARGTAVRRRSARPAPWSRASGPGADRARPDRPRTGRRGSPAPRPSSARARSNRACPPRSWSRSAAARPCAWRCRSRTAADAAARCRWPPAGCWRA